MPAPAVTDLHADYAYRALMWQKVRDCLEGEDRVKAQGQAYLPRPSAMSPQQEYVAYLKRATFYPVAERTLRGLVGMVMRHDPVLQLPKALEPMRNALTVDGNDWNVLVDQVVREVLSIGRYGVLVDIADGTPVNGVPHFATYPAEDVINWQEQYIGGKKVLTRLVLRDDIDNSYGQDAVRYLELYLDEAGEYVVNVWQAQVVDGSGIQLPPNAREFAQTESYKPSIGGKPLRYIPFVFVNPYDLRPEIEKPPFVDLCNMNLAHYRNSADYEHALYLTAQPTPWIAGNLDEGKKPKAIGSGTIWFLPENSSAGMLEFTGAGIEAQRLAMEDKEKRMAALGARMITEHATRQETAETARLRGRGETSLLTSSVNMVQAALTRAFRIAAEWRGANPDDVSVRLNKDFVEARLTPQELESLVKAWQMGAISRDTMHANLQKGEIMPPARDVETEVAAIEQEANESVFPFLAAQVNRDRA